MGNEFERELCEILYRFGFWVHNFAQNADGQPCDIIAVRNKKAYIIDCKVCSTSKGFRLERMEENQDLSMTLWEECNNGDGWFAIKMDSMIRMIPHFSIRAYAKEKSKLSASEIIECSKSLDEWVKRCR